IVNENNEFSETIAIINSFLYSNSESSDGSENEDEFLDKKNKSLLETKISTLAHNCVYFHNKIAEQYSDLY
ncbi:2442_t:CDS:1, partial [Cetraspora pellucida]